jgi:large subunit ribosomal protein L10
MITRTEKETLVTDMTGALRSSKSLVFVGFNKLTNAETIALRRSLRGESVGYTVARKTLIRRALAPLAISGTIPEMPGEIAIAYGEDLLAPARAVYEFAKTHKDQVVITGGMFDGEYKDAVAMMAIATIPPLQTLRGMFVNLINSPIQRFAIVLDQIAEKKSA